VHAVSSTTRWKQVKQFASFPNSFSPTLHSNHLLYIITVLVDGPITALITKGKVTNVVRCWVAVSCTLPPERGGGVIAFSVWTEFTVQTGKRSELPRGMPLVTRVFASSEHAWDPKASSSVTFCR
jgi:hypothetical protein